MTAFHIIKEENLSQSCPYCSRSLGDKEFRSEFENPFHYKTTVCECGKKISVKVNFDGSGHDNWNKKKTIETRLTR